MQHKTTTYIPALLHSSSVVVLCVKFVQHLALYACVCVSVSVYVCVCVCVRQCVRVHLTVARHVCSSCCWCHISRSGVLYISFRI